MLQQKTSTTDYVYACISITQRPESDRDDIVSVIKSCGSSVVCHQSAGHRRVAYSGDGLRCIKQSLTLGLIYFNLCMYVLLLCSNSIRVLYFYVICPYI